jgi:NADPH:quinone reductase-like Zn-dependent oxidoreductase
MHVKETVLKAVCIHNHGDVDVLSCEDAPLPETGPTDAQLKAGERVLIHAGAWSS